MKRNKANINYQDHPHHEGAQNNTSIEGQPNAHNNTRGMSEMNEESPEQLAGRKKQANERSGSEEQNKSGDGGR